MTKHRHQLLALALTPVLSLLPLQAAHADAAVIFELLGHAGMAAYGHKQERNKMNLTSGMFGKTACL